eukprot:2036968-Alexandrium_andersonii.AAC.1
MAHMNAAGQAKRRRLLDERRDTMLAEHRARSELEGGLAHRLVGFHLAPPLREDFGGCTRQ